MISEVGRRKHKVNLSCHVARVRVSLMQLKERVCLVAKSWCQKMKLKNLK